jgi:hypothetical protein
MPHVEPLSKPPKADAWSPWIATDPDPDTGWSVGDFAAPIKRIAEMPARSPGMEHRFVVARPPVPRQTSPR